jgi:NAD(P)-dependent dehydrogenase (short-subunit alcohol dehydrogenase family)
LQFSPYHVLIVALMAVEQKTVFITGGSGGLGRALAQAFARQGHRVAISARNKDKLNDAVRELSRGGGEALALPCDVTDRQQVQEAAEAIRRHWGHVQVLVNNAGVAKAAGFLEMPDSLWDEILATNLTGTYNCCKVFLPAMIEARWGRIINIGSTTSKVGYPHVAAYVSSKHGVVGLTRVLALETARKGITVNTICPGYLDDELTHANARRMAEKTGKSIEQILAMFAGTAPQQRLIAPEEVAQFALLLASDSMAGMTGQAISIDGGATMT